MNSTSPLLPDSLIETHNTSLSRIIQIHSSHFEQSIDSLSLSTRAYNVLKQMGVSKLSDLNGLPYQKVLEPKNCGRKTYEEVIRMLAVFAEAEGGKSENANGHTDEQRFIVIPPQAFSWPLDQLPFSARLCHVLERLQCKVLADVQRFSFEALNQMPDCGTRTVSELKLFLERVRSGEFGAPRTLAGLSPSAFAVFQMDDFLQALPEQQKAILMDRLGASGDPMTLMSIGEKFSMTRERIRQIVNLLLKKALQFGGPPLARALEEMTNELSTSVIPLTPGLLKVLMGQQDRTPRYELPFYVRLLGWLAPRLPAWPVGQTPAAYRTARQEEIISGLKVWFQSQTLPVAMAEVFRHASSGASPFEFLEALRFAAEFPLHLEDPRNPMISPPVATPRRWAQKVLLEPNASSIPIEILARAKALVSSRRSPTSRYRLASARRV